MNSRTDTLAAVTGVDEAAVRRAPQVRAVYVYEAPVRLWHWINALAITVLAVTGYFIGSPLPTMPGEASANYLMGYIRFAHFAAGYVLAIGLLARAYWAVVGNSHARELFSLPITQAAYWRELRAMAGWYLFLRPRPNQYVGHNPLARFAMVTLFLFGTIFMIVTGMALYGEGAQEGHWTNRLFTSWVLPAFGGNSQTVHTWHHLGMWALICFVIVHVYASIREDIMGRQSIVSTMISGVRTFKD
jgi:Ni/Fe-hydrogenase 1 B-type cytochrome subunit